MKIQRLKVENFGILGERGWDFAPGFQLIYGHNEAGKSTLLELIRQWLFGFDRQNAYQFESHAGKMAAEGTIETRDGRGIEFRRVKKDKDPVHGRFVSDHRPIDKESLVQILGNAHRDLYQNVFGFSLTELTAGESSLRDGRIQDALFGAGFGNLARFQQLRHQLESDHANLFTKGGRKRKTVNRLLGEITELSKKVDSAAVTPRDFQRLQEESAQAKQRLDEHRERYNELEAQRSRLQRLLNAWAPWNERRALRQQIDDLNLGAQLPVDLDHQFRQVREKLAASRDELSEIQQEFSENATELSGLKLQPDWLRFAPRVELLVQEVKHIEAVRMELPRIKHQAEESSAAVRLALHELNPQWDVASLGRFQTSLDQRMNADTMAESQRQLVEQRAQIDQQIDSLTTQIRAHTEKVNQLRVDERRDRWRAVCLRIADFRNHLENAGGLSDQLAECDQRLAKLRQNLEAGVGKSLRAPTELPVPMEQTIVEYRERFAEMDQARRREREHLERARTVVENKRHELSRLDDQCLVPDRQQLLGQRARRNEGWQIIRRKYIHQKNVDSEVDRWLSEPNLSLPDSFEQELRVADEMADLRQTHAETVANLERLAREIETADREHRRAKQDYEGQEQAREALQVEWQAHWANCHVQPRSPQAMLDWSHIHADLVEQESQRTLLTQKMQIVQDKLGDFEDELDEVFPGAGESIELRLENIQAELDASTQNANERDWLTGQISDHKARLDDLNSQREEIATARLGWQREWSDLLDRCGFPSEWDTKIVASVVDGLLDAHKRQQSVDEASNTTARLASELADFEQRVAALSDELAFDAADVTPEQAVLELNRQVDAAQKAHQRHESLMQSNRRLEIRQQRVDKQLSDATSKLGQFLQLAGVSSEADFFTVAEQAEKRRQWSAEIDGLTKQIGIARGPVDVSLFERELADGDADRWQEELDQITGRLNDEKLAYDDCVSQHALAQGRLGELDGTSAAAAYQAELESARAKLSEAVNQWAPLKLASHLLAKAIDDFARQHQPALLESVQRLLARFTANRYRHVERILDEQGSLRISHDGDQWLSPSQLSRGTREQLYVAIRLAYIEHYCERSEPLPIVMDDILVNFDDQRCEETLRVLGQLSEDLQVIFLTCHQTMVERVTRIFPDTKTIDLTDSADLQSFDAARASA